MSVRRLIAEVDVRSVNVSAFCRDHDIGRDAFYWWRKRFAAEGEAGLADRSRTPKRVANRTPLEIEDLVVAVRKQLDDAGLDAGPGSIRDRLVGRLGAVPSEATIWRMLRRRGFIVADPTKRPTKPYRRFSAERANECWQFDVTHWTLRDGTVVEIINGIDDCSRLAVACTVVPVANLANVWDTFCTAGARHGWPERTLTDNGTVFGPTFARNLAALGIGLRHSRPYHPQTCGKVERFHRTLQKRLDAQHLSETIAELQQCCDTFIAIYNHDRKHRAIGRRTPHDVWTTTPKSGPADRPLQLPDANARSRIYTTRVYNGVTWAANYRIKLGATHNGQHATSIVTGNRCHIFINGNLVRELTIDPTRQNQPLHPTQ